MRKRETDENRRGLPADSKMITWAYAAMVRLDDGTTRKLTGDERNNLDPLPEGARLYKRTPLTSQMIQRLIRWMEGLWRIRTRREDDDPDVVPAEAEGPDEQHPSGSAASQDTALEEHSSASDVDREADSHSITLPKEVSSSDKGKPSEPPSDPDETDPPASDQVVVPDGDRSDADVPGDERTEACDASPGDETDEQVVAEGSAPSRDLEPDERGPGADAVFDDSSKQASTSEAVEESDRSDVVRQADPTTSDTLVVTRGVSSDGCTPSADTADRADPDPAGTQEEPFPRAAEESDPPTFVPETDQRLPTQQSYESSGVAPPRRIGGRRLPADSSRERPAERRFTPRPELICREAGWPTSWQVVIAIPDEMSVAAVHHDGNPLEETGGEFVLPRFVGEVTVTGGDDVQHHLRLDPPLIFKLPQDWRGDGRKVRGITKGHYIVMVPREQEWRADDAPVEPAPCQDDKFMAHFVYHEGDNESAPRGLDPDVSGLLARSFTLEGVSVHDDSNQGVLYVGDPPELECEDGIVWARIGEEGRSGWTVPFQPDVRSLGEALGERQGHFFIRVYDENTELQDSAEFRYHRSLREIRVNDQPYTGDTVIAPSATGHSEATIEFVTSDSGLLRPSADPENGGFSIVESKVVVPAVPDPDRISLKLASDGGETPCVIALPRIWWCLEPGGQDPADWSDQPPRMTRDDFRDRADAGTVLRLRLPRPVTSVKVGFDEGGRQIYRPHRPNREAEIPLEEFAEYTQIEERLEEDAFLTAQWEECDWALIRIAADPRPVVRQAVSEKPGGVRARPDSSSTIRPVARSQRGDVRRDRTIAPRRYELMTIHRPELTEGEYQAIVSELTEFLTGEGAIDQETDRWGKRRMAYEIDHVREGYYTVTSFTSLPSVVDRLRRVLSLSDKVIRHKIIRPEDTRTGI